MASSIGTSLADLEVYLREHHLRGSGIRSAGDPPPPREGYAAGLWKWAELYPALEQSGKLVRIGRTASWGSVDGVIGMRVVTPLGHGRPIHMDAQLLMPGERTHAHRNMKSETRLVLSAPPEAVFVCEDEGFPMERGDLIVSPSWTNHDHWNRGDEPAVFVDAYDTGYSGLGANINESFPDDAPYQTIAKSDGYSRKTRGHVRASTGDAPYPLPPAHYPWSETSAALDALRESEADGDPADGLHLRFTSPVDGGPTLPTISWAVQLLRPRERTGSHRHNSTTFYHVFEGEGAVEIEGERLEWTTGDFFVIPPWTWHHHEHRGTGGDAIVFSVDDWPAMTKLGFYKSELA